MTIQKAREFFSSYHEGTLELGLRQPFERLLRSDAQLRAEYEAFARTVESLESMRAEPIEPPFDLHERISARLDRDLWVRSRSGRVPIWLAIRQYALGGIAVAALIGAIVSMQAGGGGFTADPFGATSQERLRFSADGRTVVLAYDAPGSASVTVSRASGVPLQSFQLQRQRLRSPITNTSLRAELVRVTAGEDDALLAVPGSRRDAKPEGKGTLGQFATALAGWYLTPVRLEAKDANVTVSWRLRGVNPADAVSLDVGNKSVTIDQESNGLLRLSAR